MLAGCASPAATPTQAPPTTASTTAAAKASSTTAPSTTAAAVTTSTVQPVKGGTLKTAKNRQAISFGYPPTLVGSDADFATPYFERLIAVGEGGVFKPELATSWETSADGKTITFKLRQGVKFHDGTNFNAKAVKSNIDACIAPNPIVLSGISSVDAVDDYTIRVNLPTANNLVLYLLASSFSAYIASPTAIEKNGKDWAATHPVGTGPFMVTAYDRNTGLTMVKNPDYWDKGLPYLDGMQYLTITDPMTAMAAFQKGDLNQIYDVNITVADQLKKEGYPILQNAGGYIGLALDTKSADTPLANPKVRKSLEYAIDKEAICAGPGGGYYTPVYQVFRQTSQNNDPNSPPRKYDQAKAKQLLAEAGYPNGFSFKGFFQDTTWRDGITAIQQNLAAVGVKLEVNYINAAAYTTLRAEGKIEKGGACNLVANVFSNDLFVLDQFWRTNAPFYSFVARPAGVDDLINKATASTDAAEVKKITQQIAKSFYDNSIYIPLWTTPRLVVMDKTVQNPTFFINADPTNNYLGRSTWLKK
jgi:peptide/nickel transport system substrate-binding protein